MVWILEKIWLLEKKLANKSGLQERHLVIHRKQFQKKQESIKQRFQRSRMAISLVLSTCLNLFSVVSNYSSKLCPTMAPLPSFNLFPKGTLFFETTTAASTLVDKSTSLFNASESAYRASVNIKNWLPKDKHMINSTAKKSAKFDTNDPLIVKDRVIEALRSPNATFLPNGSSSNSYQIITDMNRVIGTKGQTSLKVVVDKNGNIWTAYPVK